MTPMPASVKLALEVGLKKANDDVDRWKIQLEEIEHQAQNVGEQVQRCKQFVVDAERSRDEITLALTGKSIED